MFSKVVFFGNADQGKSTIIGYLYAISNKIDLNKTEKSLRKRLGTHYSKDILYASLINPEFRFSDTILVSEKTYPVPNGKRIEDKTEVETTGDETFVKTTTVINGIVKERVTKHKSVTHRFNTTIHRPQNIKINHGEKVIEIITLDTPGHLPFVTEREAGISIGDIGVFCVSAKEVLDDKFADMLLGYQDLWFNFHKTKKIIYVLTKFDLCNFSQDDYLMACDKIKRCCRNISVPYLEIALGDTFEIWNDEPDIAAIIPVSIDFSDLTGVNIIEKSKKTLWYNGMSLIDTINDIEQRYFRRPANQYVNDLMFSVDKDFNTTKNKVGKVWRIHIWSGRINVGDKITLTSVKLEGKSKNELYDIKATIKAIHTEFDSVEEVKEVEQASSMDLVTIDLKDCTLNGRKIAKKDIITTKQSIGFGENEEITKEDTITIKLDDWEKTLEEIDVGEQVVLLWFGNRVSANVVEIPDELDKIVVKLYGDITLDIPKNRRLKEIDAISNVVFYVNVGSEIKYFSGEIV